MWEKCVNNERVPKGTVSFGTFLVSIEWIDIGGLLSDLRLYDAGRALA